MKATLAILAMLVAVSQAHAQSIQYDEATNTVVDTQAAPAAQVVSAPVAIAQVAAPAPAATTQSTTTAVTVVTPAQVVAAPTAQSLGIQPQVVEQPATVITETPVKDSRQELLKKARGQMEDHTERKIEEKIEEARIRDEKKRSDRLNNAIDTSEQPTPIPVVAPYSYIAPAPLAPEAIAPAAPIIVAPNAQAVVIPAAPVKEEVKVVEKKEVVTVDSADEVRPVVREELRSDMARNEQKKEDKGEVYIGAVGGITDYSSAANMKANGTGGFQVGYITKNRIVVEGGFAYSSFNIQQQNDYYTSNYSYLPYKDMSQYNITAALKYQILPGTFRPYAGVLASYTMRNYSSANQYNTYYGTNQDASTNAIDVGFTLGLDVAVTQNLLIGAEFRYLTNVTNHQDSAYQQATQYANSGGGNTTPVEEIDYYSAGVTAKLLF